MTLFGVANQGLGKGVYIYIYIYISIDVIIYLYIYIYIYIYINMNTSRYVSTHLFMHFVNICVVHVYVSACLCL